jgi:hypothetical protein
MKGVFNALAAVPIFAEKELIEHSLMLLLDSFLTAYNVVF